MDSIGGVYGGQPTEEVLIRDTVSKETKERYDELLTMISEILVKKPPTEADSIALDECFKELQQMQKKGLDSTMNDTLNLLYFYMEGAGANPSIGDFKIDPVKIEALNSDDIKITLEVPDEDGVKTTQELKLAEAILAMVDPNYNPNVTTTLSKMLIDYSKHGYEFYTSELEGLKEQLDIASTSINNLKALQDILNMAEVDDPIEFNLNPEKWEDIPPELQNMLIDKLVGNKTDDKVSSYFYSLPKSLQNKIKDELGGFLPTAFDGAYDKLSPATQNEIKEFFRAPYTPRTAENFADVQKLITSDPNGYASMIEEIAKEGVSVTPTPQPNDVDAMNRLIKARDELQAQYDALNALGDDEVDKGEGSAYATIKKVLEDIEKYVPSSTYPPGCKIESISIEQQIKPKRGLHTAEYKFEVVEKIQITKADGETTLIEPEKLNEDICNYIMAGHDEKSSINEAIDDAVNASQNLSSKMSDEIKAQNLNLQTWFDILTQVADALNKSLQAAAQKTG